jgi:hypothetical protein
MRRIKRSYSLQVSSTEVLEIFNGNLHLREVTKSIGMLSLIPLTNVWVLASLTKILQDECMLLQAGISLQCRNQWWQKLIQHCGQLDLVKSGASNESY